MNFKFDDRELCHNLFELCGRERSVAHSHYHTPHTSDILNSEQSEQANKSQQVSKLMLLNLKFVKPIAFIDSPVLYGQLEKVGQTQR